ncbi:MAG: hypothetical protein HY801_14190, partial [Candidatus Lindowbacteria bacterium]|nr:hypothetical protein [Candidatus Lindowbacteria bacterium]
MSRLMHALEQFLLLIAIVRRADTYCGRPSSPPQRMPEVMMKADERSRFRRYYAPAWLMADGEFPCQRRYCLKVTEISIDGLRFVSNVDVPGEIVFGLSFEAALKEGQRVRISGQAAILWHTYD